MPPSRPDAAALVRARRRKLPDVIAPRLRILFCGINPGLYSTAVGHHFGRPGNRFWKALHASGFTPRLFSPSEDSTLLAFGIGITNLCPRTTASADELTAAELERGGRALVAKARRYRPRVVAILGIGAYRAGFGRPEAVIGTPDARDRGVADLGPAQPERPQRALRPRGAHPPLPHAARGGGGDAGLKSRTGWNHAHTGRIV